MEMEVVGSSQQTYHMEMEVVGSSQTHHMEIGSRRAAPQPYDFQFPYINKDEARLRAEEC